MRRLFLLGLLVAIPPTATLFATDPAPALVARFGSRVLRHPDQVHSLAITPDGALVASGGTDGCVRVWDAKTGKEVYFVRGDDAAQALVAFSPDGGVLVAAFGDQKIRLYHAKDGKPIRTVPAEPVAALTVSNGAKLVGGVSYSGQTQLLESETGLERMEVPDAKAMTVFADGSAVVMSDLEQTVTVYEIPSGKPRLTVKHPNRDGVTALAVSADGARLATADPGETGRVRLWDAKTGERLGDWPGEGPLAFLPDGVILGRRNGIATTWDAKTGRVLRAIGPAAESLAVTADGSRLVTSSAGPRIHFWNPKTGEETTPESDGIGAVTGLDASSGALVALTSRGVMPWSPKSKLEVLPGSRSRSPAVVAGRRLVGTDGNTVAVWEPRDAERGWSETLARTIRGIEGPPQHIIASASGSRVALVTNEQTLTIADPASGETLHSWSAGTRILSLVFSPGGDHLLTVGRDGFVRCWDVSKAKSSEPPAQLWTSRVPRSLKAGLSITPDGRFVAVSSIIRIYVLDAKTGTQLHAFDRKWEDGPFQCVALSADGRFVAAGAQGSAGAVTVWELATRTRLVRFPTDAGSATHLAFANNDRLLATASVGDELFLWDLTGRSGRAAPTAAELTDAWDHLDRVDAAVGAIRIWTLVDGGAATLDVIRTGLKQANTTNERIAKLIADLDAEAFATRRAAGEKLKNYAEQAIPALTKAADRSPSPEVQQQAERLLREIERAGATIPANGLFGEPLRHVRAIALLEHIGTPDAIALIREIASHTGPASDEAKVVLMRLGVKE